jgi:hypothetical protein
MSRWLPLLAILAACSDDAAPDAAPVDAGTPDALAAILELDVIVEADQATILQRDVGPECLTPRISLPDPGVCVVITDWFGVGCPPNGCITGYRLERDGVVLAATPPAGEPYMPTALPAPGLTDAPAELVVEGCGEPSRVPLTVTTPDPPTISDITINPDGETWASWTSPAPAPASLTSFPPWNSACRGELGKGRVSGPPGRAPLAVFLLGEPEAHAAGIGTVRVWGGARSTLDVVTIPHSDLDDPTLWILLSWTLPDPELVATIDGVTSSPAPGVNTIGYRMDGWVPTLTFASSAFTFAGGREQDTLTMDDCSASFPHVEPSNPLDLGVEGDGLVALAVGPVTCGAHTASFTFALDTGLLPRPVPF